MPSNNSAHNALVKEVLQVFHAHRAFAFQTNVMQFNFTGSNGKRYHVQQGVKGMADVLALRDAEAWGNNAPVWVECKTGRGEQSEFQKSFQEDVEMRGHRYILCRDTRELEKELWG
jgi:hypothetical protein